jgi:two-component system NarL family response regulator
MRRVRILIARRRAPDGSRITASHLSVEEVTQMGELVDAMVSRQPAVLLLAIDFPGLGGAPAIRRIRRLSPDTKIIILSRSVNEQEELEVLRMGARGYCGPLDSDVLLKMIDKVREGEIWAGRRTIGALLDDFYSAASDTGSDIADDQNLATLTSREREILNLLASGPSNKEIASALNVTVSTVKAHLTKMFRKLGQPDRLHLALYAAKSRRMFH